MPYVIHKISGKSTYKVVNKETGRVHAKNTSYINAQRQVKLLYALDRAVVVAKREFDVMRRRLHKHICTTCKRKSIRDAMSKKLSTCRKRLVVTVRKARPIPKVADIRAMVHRCELRMKRVFTKMM